MTLTPRGPDSPKGGWTAWLSFGVLALVMAAWTHLRSSKVPDVDILYHLAHSRAMWTEGIFMREFPWATASVIGDVGADIWWGFHVFLMPVSWMKPGPLQIQLAGILVLFTSLMLLYGSMRVVRCPLPWLWPILLLWSSSSVNWRMTMIRPQVISLACLALLLAYGLNRNAKGVFWASLGFAFIHQTASWMVLPLVVLFFGLLRVWEPTFRGRELVATLTGLVLPWILRSDPVGAIQVMKVQIVDLYRVKASDVKLNFGTELAAYPPSGFFSSLGLVLGFGFIVLLLWFVRKADDRASKGHVIAVFGVTAILMFATIFVTRRALDPAMAALAVTLGLASIGSTVQEQRWISGIAVALMILTGISSQRLLDQQGVNPMRLQALSAELKQQVPKGEVITHIWWPMFADLMYHSPEHRFIGGMDPIFQYVHSPQKWNALRDLPVDQDPGKTLAEKFSSRTLVLIKSHSPDFLRRLNTTSGVTKLYEDSDYVVFQFPAKNLTQSSRN